MMSRPTLQAFIPLAAAVLASKPVERATQGRSYSFSSSTSTSPTYSRAPEDLVDRLACHEESTVFQLWSAGNVRIRKMDLTIPSVDAVQLIEALREDSRFEVTDITYLADDDRDDWKISFRRTSFATPMTSPALSDSE